MANHYHLAVCVGAVPLARTMAYLQARVSTRHNRRGRSSGPLWQSRYRTKIVNDQTYLLQLVAYTGELARLLGWRPEVVTRWAKRAGETRVEDAAFRDAYEPLDGKLATRRQPDRR